MNYKPQKSRQFFNFHQLCCYVNPCTKGVELGDKSHIPDKSGVVFQVQFFLPPPAARVGCNQLWVQVQIPRSGQCHDFCWFQIPHPHYHLPIRPAVHQFSEREQEGRKRKRTRTRKPLIPKGKREFKTIQITSLTSLVAASIPMIPASRDTITGVRDPNLRPIWIIKQDWWTQNKRNAKLIRNPWARIHTYISKSIRQAKTLGRVDNGKMRENGLGQDLVDNFLQGNLVEGGGKGDKRATFNIKKK